MTDDQVYEFIRARWEDKKMRSWDEIAKQLQKAGYSSKRTLGPLSAAAVRSIYYNFHKKPAMAPIVLRAKLDSLRAVLALKGDADTKLKLIEQMINNLDT
jgi:hypothetical protein